MSSAVSAIGGLLGGAVSSIFGKTPKEKQAPTAPTPDDAEAKRGAIREQQRKYAGKGRAGTVLTDQSTLG